MRRADLMYRQAVATTRRRQLARLVEALEMMTAVKPRTEQEAVDKEAAIQDLMHKTD